MFEGVEEIRAQLQVARLSQLEPLGRREIIVEQTRQPDGPSARRCAELSWLRSRERRGVELHHRRPLSTSQIRSLTKNPV